MSNPDLDYLDENAKKDGVTVTASGLQYRVLEEGTGYKPGPRDKVKVHYAGRLVNGKEFDSSYKRGQPIDCLLYTSPSPRDEKVSRMPSSA